MWKPYQHHRHHAASHVQRAHPLSHYQEAQWSEAAGNQKTHRTELRADLQEISTLFHQAKVKPHHQAAYQTSRSTQIRSEIQAEQTCLDQKVRQHTAQPRGPADELFQGRQALFQLHRRRPRPADQSISEESLPLSKLRATKNIYLSNIWRFPRTQVYPQVCLKSRRVWKRPDEILRNSDKTAIQTTRVLSCNAASLRTWKIKCDNPFKNWQTPHRPNEVLLADINYVAIKESWLYLAAAMDLQSKSIIGYEIEETMDPMHTELIYKAP